MTSGSAVGLLLLGLVIGAYAAFRLYLGMSYTAGAQMPRRVSRKDDPFTFWIQVGPIVASALFFIAIGLFGLLVRGVKGR